MRLPSTHDCELALVAPFGPFDFRRYFSLPRVAYGLDGINHECDLLVLSRAGYLTEVEIKISRSDFMADFKKKHTHKSDIISAMYYAVPTHLVEYAKKHIPEGRGLIEIRTGKHATRSCAIVVVPASKTRVKAPEGVVKHMYELMAMRYWSHMARERKRIIEAQRAMAANAKHKESK